MKATRLVTVAVLMIASTWALHVVRAERIGKKPATENQKEQPDMTNEKVIMLIEAKIQPQRRTELVEALRQYLPLVRAEPGVEAFYVATRKDDPNTFVFLRDLPIASRTGFPSAAGLHEDIPGHPQ